MATKLMDEYVLPTHDMHFILEKIKKYIRSPRGFFQIVSLNPENIVIAQGNRTFKRIVKTARMTIIDGVGIELAARMLHIEVGERIPGVDLMNNLISLAGKTRSTVLLIGGRKNLAEDLAKCYHQTYRKAKFIGIQGYRNVRNPTQKEEKDLRMIVRAAKPQIVFAAFGSPTQEIWLEKHKSLFRGCVCMGVGGAFDYLSGRIRRPHSIIRRLGLEWLARLLKQPWRAGRQLRLIVFAFSVIKQAIHETLEIPKSPKRSY